VCLESSILAEKKIGMSLFELLFPKKAIRMARLEHEKNRLEFREKFLEGEIEGLKGVKLSYDEHVLFNMLIKAYGKNNHNSIPVTIYIKDCYEAIMWLRDKR
jgi:hypothetical protein